jgi:hypothetical protein
MKDAGLPITLIVVGLIWLLWYLGWMPDRDWVIGLGFVAGGIAVLVLDGFTKNSVVIGPFLVAIGLAWLAHDQYRLSWSIIVPLMLVLLGVLMLVARSPSIPDRRRGKANEAGPRP